VTGIVSAGANLRGRRTALGQFCIGLLLGAVSVPVVGGMVCAAYIVKSAMGIDLFPGPSALHEPLFEVARALRGGSADRVGLMRGVGGLPGARGDHSCLDWSGLRGHLPQKEKTPASRAGVRSCWPELPAS
jgi:hypothetical protein